jgi:ankyrin repeat protein
MQAFNLFALRSQQRLRKLDISPEQRRRVLTRVLQNVNELDVLTPMGYNFLFEDGEEDAPQEVVSQEEEFIDDNSDARVLAKQIALGIQPKIPEQEEEGIEFKWGRTRLHEAVAMGDKGSITKFLQEGDDPSIKDNNRQTPYDLAILNDQRDIMALLEQFGADV